MTTLPDRKSAFTIMEIIIVTVIVAIIAAFALPQYSRSIAKTEERKMITNLTTIRTAVQKYLSNTGDPLIQDWNNTDAINNALGLSIIDNTNTYRCYDILSGRENYCRAASPDGWSMHFHSTDHNIDMSIHCANGPPFCPTCPQDPNNCG